MISAPSKSLDSSRMKASAVWCAYHSISSNFGTSQGRKSTGFPAGKCHLLYLVVVSEALPPCCARSFEESEPSFEGHYMALMPLSLSHGPALSRRVATSRPTTCNEPNRGILFWELSRRRAPRMEGLCSAVGLKPQTRDRKMGSLRKESFH